MGEYPGLFIFIFICCRMHRSWLLLFIVTAVLSCKKGSPSSPVPPAQHLTITSFQINGISAATYTGITINPIIRIAFSVPVDPSSVTGNITLNDGAGAAVAITTSLSNHDSALIIQPASSLQYLKKYILSVFTGLQSSGQVALSDKLVQPFMTALDSTDKFPLLSDSALLTLVQQQTFKYFWDFGHPVSGMTRERATSGDVVTTGGTGFGIMAMLAGIERSFISRSDGLARIEKIVTFLTSNAQHYHGAFPHWINGSTGATIPFSTQDDGGDLVETAYLMQGLLCARQYFNQANTDETNLRTNINSLWNEVDWTWYRQNNQNTLYWHWSPDYNWSTNQQISGWNEALITYVLAASAPTDSIPKIVYDNGWALNGAMKNNKTFYGIQLPLGPDRGGPLFFAHYSFLGINPNGLSDAYANYWTQDTAHARINYLYCVSNPNNYYGYSSLCWGLTASDEQNGYSAHSPTNDDGVISPTAAIASLPYTPTESMNALRFFYYKLGDKIWGQYGFVDAFNLTNSWFDNDFLAIDQGPEIVMIENYRSGLLWNLFMSCPEIKTGMKKLGFQGPNL